MRNYGSSGEAGLARFDADAKLGNHHTLSGRQRAQRLGVGLGQRRKTQAGHGVSVGAGSQRQLGYNLAVRRSLESLAGRHLGSVLSPADEVVHVRPQPIQVAVIGQSRDDQQHADGQQRNTGPTQAVVLRLGAHLHIVQSDFHLVTLLV